MVYVVQYMHMKLANTVELDFEFSPTIYQSYNLPDLRHGRTSDVVCERLLLTHVLL